MQKTNFNHQILTQQAKEFAYSAHKNHYYPDGRPYASHLETVSALSRQSLLEDATLHEGTLMCVSYLHDTIEDTKTRYEDLVMHFGSNISDSVLALSKNKSLSKQEQIQDSLKRILLTSKEARVVKLADRIANLSQTLLLTDKKWTPNYKEYYREESILIHQKLGGSSSILSQKLAALISIYNRI